MKTVLIFSALALSAAPQTVFADAKWYCQAPSAAIAGTAGWYLGTYGMLAYHQATIAQRLNDTTEIYKGKVGVPARFGAADFGKVKGWDWLAATVVLSEEAAKRSAGAEEKKEATSFGGWLATEPPPGEGADGPQLTKPLFFAEKSPQEVVQIHLHSFSDVPTAQEWLDSLQEDGSWIVHLKRFRQPYHRTAARLARQAAWTYGLIAALFMAIDYEESKYGYVGNELAKRLISRARAEPAADPQPAAAP